MLRKKYKVVFTFLSMAFFATASIAAPRGKMPARAAIPVVLAPVVKASDAKVAQTIGSITDPKMATLSAGDAGHVTEIGFENGEHVKKGQLLVQLNDALEKAQLASAKAKSVASATQYKRSIQLSEGKVQGLNVSPLSEQDLANTKSTYLQDKANVEQQQALLDKRSVIAPFAGKTGAITVSVGDYVTPGQALVDLVNYKELQVSFSIPEDQIDQLHMGQEISFSTPLFPGQTFDAIITFMAPAVDADTRTLACLATLKESTEKLRPGLFVQVDLSEHATQQALQIPEQALVAAYPNYVVYRVVNNKAVKTPVTIGQRTDGNVIITKGLKLGEQVVIAGQSNLSNGQAVAITAP